MDVRVGVIGAGIMGTDHARILHRDVPHATVVVVSDVDEARAAAVVAGIPGASTTADARAVIGSAEVDAVLIASSDDTHAEYVQACLAVGKPVLCEKPLAPTAAECMTLLEAESETGKSLISVGFMRRFDPGYVDLKALIRDGSLGVPLIVHSTGRGVSAPAGSDELSVTGSAIHDLDIVPWLLDTEVVSASWQAPGSTPHSQGRTDPQFILLRTTDGVLVTVDIFLNARYGYDIRCEVVGSASTAALTEPSRVARDRDLTHGHSYAADWRPRFAEAYRLQNRAWVESLVQGTPSPLASAEDALRAARIADAVIASMHTDGAWVEVSGE